MRWQLTTHAVEQYITRIAPGLTHEQADVEIRAALGAAHRDRDAERARRGQVWAGAASGRRLTHFIVLPPSDPTTRGRPPVVVTCWPSDYMGDEADELMSALKATDGPFLQAPRDWGALVGRLEAARERSLALRARLARVDEMQALLLRLAVE